MSFRVSGSAEDALDLTRHVVGPCQRVDLALAALRRGEIILIGDEPADAMAVCSPTAITERHTRQLVGLGPGFIDVALSDSYADRLRLLPLDGAKAFVRPTISVDSASAARDTSPSAVAVTLRALGDPDTRADDLVRPGQVFPFRCPDAGVAVDWSRETCAVEAMVAAGLPPAAVMSQVVWPSQVRDRVFLRRSDLVFTRHALEGTVTEAGAAEIPTEFGRFRASAFATSFDEIERVTFSIGRVEGPGSIAPVAAHEECATGDIFGSLGCPCRTALRDALSFVGRRGSGLVVYTRDGDREYRHVARPPEIAGSEAALSEAARAAVLVAIMRMHGIERFMPTTGPARMVTLTGAEPAAVMSCLIGA